MRIPAAIAIVSTASHSSGAWLRDSIQRPPATEAVRSSPRNSVNSVSSVAPTA